MSTSTSTASNLPYLFDRPSEPLFTGRDDVSFEVPTELWPDRYKNLASSIQTRFPSSGQVIAVKSLRQLPDISDSTTLDRHENFSLFNPYHRHCATKLIEKLMSMPNVDEFLSACVYARERVNPYVFNYAASVAILHRPDTRNVPLPANVQVFPEMYVDSGVFVRAREEVAIVPQGSRIPIEVPRDYTASDLDEEHRVAYFREDVGINLHHWHWHLVYPFDGPREIVAKNRRGELFYYMHQQILARYNFERLSNGLGRVRRMNNFRDPIPEGYYPKMDSFISSRIWASRQANSYLRDLNRDVDQLHVDVLDLEKWRDRIETAINDGFVRDASTQRDLPLTETDGIDILGNIIEASSLSVNRNRYGDIHNLGHMMLSFVHDPDNRYLETFGVMGTPMTAMRDPVFYALHAYINDIFMEHKDILVPYTTQQLGFDGVRVTGVEVSTEGARPNEFLTFWQQNDIDLSRGLDFQPRGSVFARLTHLQHAPFTYRITVENGGSQRIGTVRIFIAPRFDERGASFLYRDQKGLFVELDRFTRSLTSGTNTITRRSTESTVTIPYEQTFRTLSDRPTGGTALESYNYCGCGWPQHMLIAKGNAEGFAADLFVMVSDGRNDTVQQNSQAGSPGCDDAQSYCGVRNGLYPDRRAMGFPFDRQARPGVNILQQFLTSNMFVQNAIIRFSNRVVAGTPSSTNRPANQNTSTNRQPNQPAQGNRPTPARPNNPRPVKSTA